MFKEGFFLTSFEEFTLPFQLRPEITIIQNQEMTSNNTYSLRKRRYAQISVKKRMALVRLVVQDGKSLSEAGRKMHINPSTVRLIVKKYNQTGTVFHKRLRNMPREEQARRIDQIKPVIMIKQEENDVSSEDKSAVRVLSKEQDHTKLNSRKLNEPFADYPFLYYGYLY